MQCVNRMAYSAGIALAAANGAALLQKESLGGQYDSFILHGRLTAPSNILNGSQQRLQTS